jgi:hypothetical protein
MVPLFTHWHVTSSARRPEWRPSDARRNLSHSSAYCFSDNDTHRVFNLMTTGLTDDPEHWRDRAHEARTRAGQLNDPEAKRQMLGIARGYDRLAERAQERLRAASPPPGPSR